ncbi:MAG: Fpg/Nei family DNA glycosylase [Chlamydiota bacterium]
MPELPDVECMRRQLEKALHRTVEQLWLRMPMIANMTQQTFRRHLNGHQFTFVQRHGKHLFLKSKEKILHLHFGMTGDIIWWKDEEPDYSAFEVKFRGGENLSIISKRKLGKVELVDELEDVIEDLGPDALDIGEEEFKGLIRSSRAQLKSCLMDQGKLAGIGNVYSDEILYQARLNPTRIAQELTERDIHNLYHKMREVLKVVIDNDADPDKFPQGYLTPHRSKGGEVEGHKVENKTINGRSAYWCPEVQS